MSRITEKEKDRAFFYAAEQSAGMYDGTIELVVPHYKLLHQTMLDLLQYHFRTAYGIDKSEIDGWVLDVGSGTGEESIGVLKAFPNIKIIALDFCRSMHTVFRKNLREKLSEDVEQTGRLKLVTGDILNGEGTKESLLSYLPEEDGDKGYSAILSSFTIHHFTSEQKEEAYRRIYEVLSPGGLFINGDLFSYQSQELSSIADEYEIRRLANQFDNPDPEFEDAVKIPKPLRESLKKAWLSHYKSDNILGPVESARDSLQSASDEKGQAEMLLNVGFDQVGCPFRLWQVGILWAKKE